MEKGKVFKAAPLPFQGQKRNFVNEFKDALIEMKAHCEITTIVDLFGGSGLLSHTAKRLYPECRVIYNDFDDFHLRLANIGRTNEMLSKLRALLPDAPKGVRVTGENKERILEMIKEYEDSGFVDYITLSGSLLFSGQYVTSFEDLTKSGMYARVRLSDYDAANYLDGLEVVKAGYMELFERFRGQPGVLFVADPPYLSTDCTTYGSNKYWKLKDYLDVLNVLKVDNYCFFTSNKSSLVELCEWFAENYAIKNPFENATLRITKGKVNYNAQYTDMMLYKYRKIRI